MTGQQQFKKALPMTYATAFELLQASHQFKLDASDEKSPKLTLLPSGEAAHRIFMKGVLQDVKQNDSGLTATFRDRSGKIFLRASQEYQPDAYLKLRGFKDLPAFVAVVGRINLFTPPPEEGKNPVPFVSINLDDIGHISKADRYAFDRDVLRLTRERVAAWGESLTDLQLKAREIYGSGCEAGIMQRVESLFQEAGVTI
ncbi:hypothetical protein [Methanospirillum sp.]